MDLIAMKQISAALFLFISATCWSQDRPSTEQIEKWTANKTIVELQQLIANKKLTSVQLTQFYIDKIKKEDHKYNSVIGVNPKALAQAKHLDNNKFEQFTDGELPLFGMPILLKDNIETREQATTAGSLILKNNFTNRDATLTKRLRDAGAIILGKTNLSEWANFRSERSSSGWSAIGGQTKNPHDVTRTPCGSSSGSGAAVAANFAIAAIGTETNGSITCPAAVNGVVGVKPSVGLVSRHAIVPISPSQDTAGPMTKFVDDAHRILFAIQGADNLDAETKNTRLNPVTLETAQKDLKRLRLGLVYSSAEQHEQVVTIKEGAIKKLKAAGITIIDELKFETYDGFWPDSYQQLSREFKTSLNNYFASLPSDVPDDINSLTLQDVIDFNNKTPDEMEFFQQEIFLKSQKTDGMNTQRYKNLKKKLKRITDKEGIDALIKKHNLDGLIAITRGPAWKIDLINGDHSNGGVSTFAAIAGTPHITIPINKLHGLPIGLSVMTNYGDDAQALAIAAQIEKLLSTQQ